jgi:hypothetical protein
MYPPINNLEPKIASLMKSDAAEVAVEEWDARLVAGLELPITADTSKAARVLRNWLLKGLKRRQTQGFFSWLHQKPEYHGVGLDSMDHVVGLAQMCNHKDAPMKNLIAAINGH